MPIGAVIAIGLGFVFAGLITSAFDIPPMLLAIIVMGIFTACVEFYIRTNRKN
jgi:hypothetical protein